MLTNEEITDKMAQDIQELEDDRFILEMSLKVVTGQLNALIDACLDENSKPKVPAMGDIMKAKALLPAGYKHSFKVKEKVKKNAN